MTPASSLQTLRLYYAATVVFLLLDVGLHFNIRASFLEGHTGLRLVYYGLCLLLFAMTLRRPDWAEIAGAGESLLNLSALILSMGVRVLRISNDMIDHGTGFVTLPEVLNFVIVGGIAWLSWQSAVFRLKKKFH